MSGPRPNLSGLVHPEVERAVMGLFALVDDLQAADRRIVNGANTAIRRIAPDPQRIRRALQSNGTHPLNVEGLIGLLAQPQTAGVRSVTALPDVLLSQDGELVFFNQVLYRFDGTTEPGVWRVVGAAGVVLQDTAANFSANYPAANYPLGTLFYVTDRNVWYLREDSGGTPVWRYRFGTMRGTLSPDQKPAGLGANDTGFLFFATDFDRRYRWGGAAWADDEAQPPRFMIGMFDANSPMTGWALCDGTAVTLSTGTGGTTPYTTPNLTGTNRFFRSATGAGLTGGAATHTHTVDPPVTTSSGASTTTTSDASTITTSGASTATTSGPSATTTSDASTTTTSDASTTTTSTPSNTTVVQAGTGNTVASLGHTHTLSHTHDHSHTHEAPSHTHTLSHTHDHSHTHTLAHTHTVDIASFTSGSTSNLPPYYEIAPFVRL